MGRRRRAAKKERKRRIREGLKGHSAFRPSKYLQGHSWTIDSNDMQESRKNSLRVSPFLELAMETHSRLYCRSNQQDHT